MCSLKLVIIEIKGLSEGPLVVSDRPLLAQVLFVFILIPRDAVLLLDGWCCMSLISCASKFVDSVAFCSNLVEFTGKF